MVSSWTQRPNFLLEILTLEDARNMMSQNVGDKTNYAAKKMENNFIICFLRYVHTRFT